MQPQVFPGTYTDGHGTERIMWRIGPSRHWGANRFDIRTVIRGVPVAGPDFDALGPYDKGAALRVGLPVDQWDAISGCAFSGELPCSVQVHDQRRPGVIHFRLTLPPGGVGESLELAIDIDGRTYQGTDRYFEDALFRLGQQFPDDIRLLSCITCLFSDYSPYGHGLTGMWCHRDAKDQYLAVRTKDDYFEVPVTEQVPETYLCADYTHRIPGTGYRG